jgi:hypothetical protein
VQHLQNTAKHPPAGAENRQAVALRVEGDRVAFINCSFYGAQGTLYDKQGRHFYYNSYIEGSIDTIFGDARSLFLVNPRPSIDLVLCILNSESSIITCIIGCRIINHYMRNCTPNHQPLLFI